MPNNGMIIPLNLGGGDLAVRTGTGLIEQWLTNQSSGNETGVLGNVFTQHDSPGSGTIAGGACRTFDGTDDWFSMTGSDTFNLVFNDSGLAVAFKPTALGGNQIVFASLSGGGVPSYMVRCEGTDLVLYLGDGSGSFSNHTIQSGMTNGTTYVVTVDFHFVTINFNINVRVNGGSVQAFTGSPGPTPGNPSTVSLGAWTSGQFFTGSIALPTLWKVGLSDQSLLDFYNSGTPIRYTDTSFTQKIHITAGTAHTISGKFFLTNSGGTVQNGTVRITIVDDSSFLDIVNPTASTVSTIGSGVAITELDVTTSGGNIPTVNDLTVSSAVNATANASFPTVNLTVQAASAMASSTASANFPTLILSAQATDVTAAASFPIITLSAANANAQGSITGNVSFPTITLSVQTASVFADAVAPASFDYAIILTPPVVRISPDLRVDPPGYLGRFQRSAFIPFVQAFDHLPDAAPTLHIYRGLTLIASFQIPLIDSTINIFSDELFLGENYLDGQYVVVTTWTEDTSAQYKIDYFCVRGGTGLAPIHGVIEQRRPLGQAVISVDETGRARMAYDPKVPA